jgi:hypothetical protein
VYPYYWVWWCDSALGGGRAFTFDVRLLSFGGRMMMMMCLSVSHKRVTT